MTNAAAFWANVVGPTLAEASSSPADVRKAILASLVVYHASEHAFVERMGTEAAGEAHTRYWKEQASPAFHVVAAVATAAKHGTRRRNAYRLAQVHRKPPAVAGELECGISELGDTTGSVMAQPIVGESELLDLQGALRDVVKRLSADFPELGIEIQ